MQRLIKISGWLFRHFNVNTKSLWALPSYTQPTTAKPRSMECHTTVTSPIIIRIHLYLVSEQALKNLGPEFRSRCGNTSKNFGHAFVPHSVSNTAPFI